MSRPLEKLEKKRSVVTGVPAVKLTVCASALASPHVAATAKATSWSFFKGEIVNGRRASHFNSTIGIWRKLNARAC